MGINPVGSVTVSPVDVGQKTTARDNEDSQINNRVVRSPDQIDQQTAARAAAGDKRVSAQTEPLESDQTRKKQQESRARVSKEIDRALTSQAITKKDNAEF